MQQSINLKKDCIQTPLINFTMTREMQIHFLSYACNPLSHAEITAVNHCKCLDFEQVVIRQTRLKGCFKNHRFGHTTQSQIA